MSFSFRNQVKTFNQSSRILPHSGKGMTCSNHMNSKETLSPFLCSSDVMVRIMQSEKCPSFFSSYMPERARSRSPISHSLSPHSYSPSFTSCSSAHSPQGVPCRGPERGFDGMGPHRGSWEWSSHLRKGEDERERDNPWRNGSSADDDRPNGRADRRKIYQKSLDHLSLRFADERGVAGGGEEMRSSRDWHRRGSPQGSSFNSYRNAEDDFYKEQVYKSDKPLRPPYQRHDAKSKRKDGGDHHTRSRHSESNMTDEPLRRTPENKRQSSPGRSNRTSRRCTAAEKKERENATVSNFCKCLKLL